MLIAHFQQNIFSNKKYNNNQYSLDSRISLKCFASPFQIRFSENRMIFDQYMEDQLAVVDLGSLL